MSSKVWLRSPRDSPVGQHLIPARMAADPSNADEGYFNDLSRQPTMSTANSTSPLDQPSNSPNGDGDEIPKTKRIACVICRKRKLKCDGNRPKCSTCARLGHNCAYDEARRKSGPKRGYVKELEARLGTMLLSHECRNSEADHGVPLKLKLRPSSRTRIQKDPRRAPVEQRRSRQARTMSHRPSRKTMSPWTCRTIQRIRWARARSIP